MAKQRKQKLAEALAEEAAGIDIETLEGKKPPWREKPDVLSPTEQQARDQAFAERFAGLKGLKSQSQKQQPTLSASDTVSKIDIVSEADRVIPSSPPQRVSSKSGRPPRKNPIILKPVTGDATIAKILARNGNQPVTIDSGFTAVLWTVDDVLARHQTPAEQTVYRHLYRLSYGFGNTHCFIGYNGLCRRCQVTTNTLKRALFALADKKHIAILETVNTKQHKATVYRVFLPEEIKVLEKELQEYQKKEKRVSEGEVETRAEFDTVSINDTVSNSARKKKDTLSKFDTTRTDINNSRTDSILEPTLILEASYVPAGNGGSRGLVLKDPHPEKVKNLDQEYVYTRSTKQQNEIFAAMEAWERVFPGKPLPLASKLDEWLQGIRNRDNYWKGADLIALFEHALQTTREREPRDVIGWLTAGFREGYLVDPGIFSR